MQVLAALLIIISALTAPALAGGLDDAKAGLEAYQRGDLDGAITLYTMAIRSGRLSRLNLAVAYNDRGAAYGDKGQRDKAIADYDKAIELKPDYAKALFNRGGAYRDRGQYERALADYGKAIALRADYAEAYENRGITYAGMGRYEKAIADYDRAVALKPDDAGAYLERAKAYGKTGRDEKAIADYGKAIALKPNNVRAYYNRANAYAGRGRYDRAIADYDKAIALRPGHVSAHRNRAHAYFYEGRFAAAANDLRWSVVNHPADPYAVLWLYLAQAFGGGNGRKELAANARRFDLGTWPGPVAELYLGQATPERVMAGAEDSDPKRRRERRCEAFFYVGEHYLLKGEQATAVDYLRRARATCPGNFIEAAGARAQLKRFGGAP